MLILCGIEEDTLNGDQNMKRKLWVSGIVGVCVVALAVGLGVGLSNGVSPYFVTQRKQKRNFFFKNVDFVFSGHLFSQFYHFETTGFK